MSFNNAVNFSSLRKNLICAKYVGMHSWKERYNYIIAMLKN